MVEESEDEPPGGRMLLVVLLLCGFQTAIAQEDAISGDSSYFCIQGVFFNWASPEFSKCWPVSN